MLGAERGRGGPCPRKTPLRSAIWKGAREGYAAPGWDPAAETRVREEETSLMGPRGFPMSM